MAFFLQYAVTMPRTASALAVYRHSSINRRPLLRAYSLSLPYLEQQQQQQTATPLIKPWPQPCVECHGDYRHEAFLEKHVGGPMYENNQSSRLPRLPVPTLNETLERFLPTALPLASNKAEEETLLQACNAFPQEASKLQQRLVEHDEQVEFQNSSWLQQWWNTVAYLQVRDPVVVHVSYFFQLNDDDSLLEEKSHNDLLCVKRAAAALCVAAKFRNKVSNGTLAPDTIGKRDIPLCMT